MAFEASHAARQGDKTFSVDVRSGQETATIAAGLTDFLDAFDCAMEWIDREDPARSGDRSIAIVTTTQGVREQVWSYPSEPGAAPEPGGKPLVELFGFDPVAWKPLSSEVARPRVRPPARPAVRVDDGLAVGPGVARDAELEPEPAPRRPSPGERLEAWLDTGSRRLLRERLLALWGDRVSRWCLVLGALSFWLAFTLLEPAFLAPLAAAAASLWSRRGHLAAPLSDGDDDWF